MRIKKLHILFPVIIVAVFIVAVFLSRSDNYLVQQLRGPKAGVKAVFTSGDKLLVQSGANEVYAWGWNDLNKWPTVARLNTEIVSPMAVDKIVYFSKDRPDTIVVTDLNGEKQIKQIPLPFGAECKMMVPSADCSFIAVFLVENVLAMIGPELELSEVFTVANEGISISTIGISNDGRWLAIAGKENGGYALVVDTQTKSVVFQKNIPEITRFDKVIFSPDSEIVYFGENVRFIYAFEIGSGNLLRKFEIPEYPIQPNKKQIISAIDISPDGRLLAASTEPVQKLYLWNTETGEKTIEFGLPGPVVGDIAFSSGSDMIATSVVVRSTISIWKTTGSQ